MRYVMSLLVLAAAWSVATLAYATPHHAQDPAGQTGLGIRLAEVPVELKDDPRALSYIVDNVNPGTTIQRRIEIQNHTGAPQKVELYAGAANLTDSQFTIEDGRAVNELTTWTTVDPKEAELADGTSTDAVVTVAVPEDAPEGEQYAVVWAQITGPPPTGTGTQLVSRVGIRLYLNVGPGNGPPADFSIAEVTPQRNSEGIAQLVAEVENTGGRALDMAGEVRLSGGPGSLSAGPFNAVNGTTIAPGATALVTIDLSPDLPNGPWTADLTLRSGLVNHLTSASVTFPDSGVGTPVGTGDNGSGFPWVISFAVLLVALIVTVVLLLRQRSRQNT